MIQKQFKLNIPEDVKRWLAIEAARNMRSQSSEVVIALKEKMNRRAQNEKGTDYVSAS